MNNNTYRELVESDIQLMICVRHPRVVQVNFTNIVRRIQIKELFEFEKNGECMRTNIIDEVTVETAVAAAKKSLISDSDIKWIRNAALLERAYYLGLYKGLISISDSQSLKSILIHTLMNTLWERDGDNSFNSTNIGKSLQQLKDDFNIAVKGKEFATKSTSDLMNQIHSLDNQWQSCVRRALDLLTENKRTADELNRSVEKNSLDQDQHYEFLKKLDPLKLEEMLKFISLLEISHSLFKNLESETMS